MATYASKEYVFGKFDAPGATNLGAAALNAGFKKMFTDGGWTITPTGGIALLRTSVTDNGFTVCTLGYGNVNFWGVTGYTDDLNPVVTQTALVVDAGSFSGGDGACCDINNPADDPCMQYIQSQGYSPILTFPYGNNVARHTQIIYAILEVANFYSDLSITIVDGEYVTPFFFDSEFPPNVTFGNQLTAHFGPQPVGQGFFAESKVSTLLTSKIQQNCLDPLDDNDLNKVTVYCPISNRGGTFFFGPAPWLGFVYFKDNFEVKEPTVVDTFEITPAYGDTFEVNQYDYYGAFDHPITIAQSLIDTGDAIANSFKLDQASTIWCNPYTFMAYATTLAGNSSSVFFCAMKLKPLAGEQNVTEIQQALIDDNGYIVEDFYRLRKYTVVVMQPNGGGGLREFLYVQLLGVGRYAVSVRGFFNDEEEYWNECLTKIDVLGAEHPNRSWGPIIFNAGGDSTNLITNGEIVWPNSIAEMSEPWCGCNAYNTEVDSNAPILGQLWDAIIPSRNLDLAGDTTGDLFTFDGQLWRYMQVSHDTNSNPPGSMALRVADGQILTLIVNEIAGTYILQYTGPQLISANMDFSTKIIPRGQTSITVDIFFSAAGMFYFYMVNDNRMDFGSLGQVIISDGTTLEDVEIRITNIEYEESAKMVIVDSTGQTVEFFKYL